LSADITGGFFALVGPSLGQDVLERICFACKNVENSLLKV